MTIVEELADPHERAAQECDTSIAALSVHLGLEIERLKQQLATAQARIAALENEVRKAKP